MRAEDFQVKEKLRKDRGGKIQKQATLKKERLALENLLHGGDFFAAQQTGICCTADGSLLHGRFSKASRRLKRG